MSFAADDRALVVGAVGLCIVGGGLIALAPIVTAPSPGPVSVEECELAQVAVYETAEKTRDRDVESYGALTETQQSVFDEARAADGDFVRFRDRDRLVAAESLPYYVTLNGTRYRANSFLGNCRDRPWYVGLTKPAGYVLVGLGAVLGGVVARRRVAY